MSVAADEERLSSYGCLIARRRLQTVFDLEASLFATDFALTTRTITVDLSGDAYNLAFGVYGREDAAFYYEEATRVLIYESARAQFRSLELAHMVGRRCLRLDKSAPSLTKLIDEKEAAHQLAREEADEQRKRADAEEAALAQYLGGAVGSLTRLNLYSLMHNLTPFSSFSQDAATASRLGTEIAALQQEKQVLQKRVDALEAAAAAPPPSTSGSQLAHYSDHEIEVMMQKNASNAANYTLRTLQMANLIKDDGAKILASEVVPELFLPSRGGGHGFDPPGWRSRGSLLGVALHPGVGWGASRAHSGWLLAWVQGNSMTLNCSDKIANSLRLGGEFVGHGLCLDDEDDDGGPLKEEREHERENTRERERERDSDKIQVPKPVRLRKRPNGQRGWLHVETTPNRPLRGRLHRRTPLTGATEGAAGSLGPAKVLGRGGGGGGQPVLWGRRLPAGRPERKGAAGPFGADASRVGLAIGGRREKERSTPLGKPPPSQPRRWRSERRGGSRLTADLEEGGAQDPPSWTPAANLRPGAPRAALIHLNQSEAQRISPRRRHRCPFFLLPTSPRKKVTALRHRRLFHIRDDAAARLVRLLLLLHLPPRQIPFLDLNFSAQ
ncbi:hypothetical protein KSP39_PZI017227 [Platanthera zijinensis]|uniref:Uncharacterized protein n=1 Tax=Platanthera zijinensis TaxID=2320716 RepID=A0AAP0B6X6_9ASPA